MIPTDEQQAVLDLFLRGESMVIDALAGTGKTSTLRLLAGATRTRGRYLAFNRALVDEVSGKLPERCEASTAHSLAYRTVGYRYKHRLNGPRVKAAQQARYLGLTPLVVNGKRLAPGWQAGHVMRAVSVFCKTAEEAPSRRHFTYVDGIDDKDESGERTYRHNNDLADELLPALQAAWADLQATDGQLRFGHDHYLKLWQLSHPRIEADYILFDEAQDANPVMAAVVEAQDHAQRVYCGDQNQAIYGFTGAVDAMAGFAEDHRRPLTQSFRFGPQIADRANLVLEWLDSPMMLAGLPSIGSTVGEYDGTPDALLCRTNAAAIEAVLTAMEDGVRVHLVGGGTEVAAFARAAKELMQKGWTGHFELSCFSGWAEVQDYVENDPDGGELALMVRLVDKFGADTILRAVDGSAPEGPGTMSVSTAHKSKGREWPVVRIAQDMVDVDPTEDELRLRYVAFTRAQRHLDESAFRSAPAHRGGI